MTGFATKPRIIRNNEPLRVLSPFQQSFYLLILTSALGYAIFQHGGRTLLDWNLSLLLIGVSALFYWGTALFSGRSSTIERPLGWLALLVPGYVLFQLVPLPVFLVRILSPERAHLLDNLQAVMTPDSFASLSISSSTTSAHLFRVIGYLVVFLLVREIGSQSKTPWILALPLIGMAGIEAVIGFAQNSEGAVVSGTYWNRNHFAGLLEMAMPLAIGCTIALLRSHSRYGRVLRAFAAILVLLLATLMLVAVIYSLSKMGFIACLGGLFSMAAVAAYSTLQGRKRWWIVGALGLFFVLVFVFLPTDQLVNAFGSSLVDKTGEGRVPIWSDSLHLLAAYPLVGSGLGTYDTAFLKYQTALIDVDFDFAHNDYLEFAAELGALGFLILANFALAIVRKTLRRATETTDPQIRYLAWGCIGSIAAIGLHSLTDFNLYIPANALVLAWIFGIAASFPSLLPRSNRVLRRPLPLRAISFALGCLLVVYAPAWILLEGKFRGDPQTEQQFCRFGVCDIDAVIESEAAKQGGSSAEISPSTLLDAVRRESAAPLRWCDLGDALAKTGRVEQARACFSTALTLGPMIPPVQLRAANFYYGVQDRQQAIKQTSSVLKRSSAYDGQIFERYAQEKIPVTEILSKGLPEGQRAAQAYLNYLMQVNDLSDATTVWAWMLSHHYVDDSLVRPYVHFLMRCREYELAAQSWASYLGNRRQGYMQSNWIYNGDFESQPAGVAFDWKMENLGDDVKVTLDSSLAHTGLHSLRIQFAGKENVNYNGTSQTAFIKPGKYRFAAFVRTEGITTDQGIAFRISSPEPSSHLDLKTQQFTGTTDWRRIEQILTIPQGVHLVTVQIVRVPSWRFDSHIAGTAWVDTVSLSRVE